MQVAAETLSSADVYVRSFVGGFVASSGLESFWAHGLLSKLEQGEDASKHLVAFIDASVDSYATTVAGYLLDVHRCTSEFMLKHSNAQHSLHQTLDQIQALDDMLNAMTLNHVAQRASKAQGVALLTLYAKSFAPQQSSPLQSFNVSVLLQEMKKRIRAGTMHGHLAVCWAVFMAAVGVTDAKRALAMHLFLQARSILSAAVRLNVVGPYQSHRLLAFEIKDIVFKAVSHTQSFTTSFNTALVSTALSRAPPQTFAWTWQDDEAWSDQYKLAPKMTWPLGDLIQARHDQLHSRLFNS